MSTFWLVAHLVLWGTALGLAFLLVGALRGLRAWGWRLEQLEVVLSGRLGLAPGSKAPAFRLPSVQGARVGLKSFAGRRVLLVFTQSSRHPFEQLLHDLGRLQQQEGVQVLIIENGEAEAAPRLAAATGLTWPRGWIFERTEFAPKDRHE